MPVKTNLASSWFSSTEGPCALVPGAREIFGLPSAITPPGTGAQTFLFGTPNSGLHGQHALMNPSFHGPTLLAGGTDGPEGSVLVLLSEALIVVLIAIIYRRRRFPLITDRALVEDDVPRSA